MQAQARTTQLQQLVRSQGDLPPLIVDHRQNTGVAAVVQVVLVPATGHHHDRDGEDSAADHASQIAAQFSDGQMRLPTFEEAQHEVYRDIDGVAYALADMRKEAMLVAGFAYIRLGDENRAKGRRLIRVWQEMEERGLADEDTVRSLYSA